MSEKILALLALTGLIVFLLPLVIMVPHVDLILFVTVCVFLAIYDFWTELVVKNRA
jgi:hypothetical protein